MPACKRLRNWLFVINNHTYSDFDSMMAMPFKYLIFGFEIAPTTGTPHIQGYVQFEDGKTKTAVSKLMPRASIMEPNGTPQQNRAYCMKPESKVSPDEWYEFGDIGPGSGYRSDLEEIREMLLDNPVSYVAHNRFSQWAQYRRSFDAYSQMVFKPIFNRKILSYDPDSDLPDIYSIIGSNESHFFREFDSWSDYNDEPFIIITVMLMSLSAQLYHWYVTGKWFIRGTYLKAHTIFIPEDSVKYFARYKLQIKSYIDVYAKSSPQTIPEEISTETSENSSNDDQESS